MYGAQTAEVYPRSKHMFENDVEMYGAQTRENDMRKIAEFENDVEMYGAQTKTGRVEGNQSLRMM